MSAETAICTWFVADGKEDASYFPQIGARSDSPAAQAHYWRCVLCFYASSLAQNPDSRHLFFTNITPPSVGNVDIAERFRSWGIETVTLPINFRLPRNAVAQWGNQFYIFDILGWLADRPEIARAIVLDSDCLWLKPVHGIERAIDSEGALTYLLDDQGRDSNHKLNGLSRHGMAQFLGRIGGLPSESIPYFGGEIYAANHQTTHRLMAAARRTWPMVLAQGPDAPREEAHFLSILYALEGIRSNTGNAYIRRMWTAFKHNNLRESDRNLAIWHLPSEKRTGFNKLFARITREPSLHPSRDSEAMGLTFDSYARLMGFPNRRIVKLVQDVTFKVREKLGV